MYKYFIACPSNCPHNKMKLKRNSFKTVSKLSCFVSVFTSLCGQSFTLRHCTVKKQASRKKQQVFGNVVHLSVSLIPIAIRLSSLPRQQRKSYIHDVGVLSEVGFREIGLRGRESTSAGVATAAVAARRDKRCLLCIYAVKTSAIEMTPGDTR